MESNGDWDFLLVGKRRVLYEVLIHHISPCSAHIFLFTHSFISESYAAMSNRKEAIGGAIVYGLCSNFQLFLSLNIADADADDGSGERPEMSYADRTIMNPHNMSHIQQSGNHAHDLNCLTREHYYHYQHSASANVGNVSSHDGNMQHQIHSSNDLHSKSSQSNSTEKKYIVHNNGLTQNSSPSQARGICQTVNYNINQGQADPRSALSSSSSSDFPTVIGGADSTGIDNSYSTGEDGQHPLSLLHPNSHALAHSLLNDSSAQAIHRHLHQHHVTNEGETSAFQFVALVSIIVLFIFCFFAICDSRCSIFDSCQKFFLIFHHSHLIRFISFHLYEFSLISACSPPL